MANFNAEIRSPIPAQKTHREMKFKACENPRGWGILGVFSCLGD